MHDSRNDPYKNVLCRIPTSLNDRRLPAYVRKGTLIQTSLIRPLLISDHCNRIGRIPDRPNAPPLYPLSERLRPTLSPHR